jgi:formylglycine-generating enzyme required for sulfatase activity
VTGQFKPGDTFKDCDECPEMVVVPAGEFLMGSAEDDKSRDTNEQFQHYMRIPAPFAVGKFEITKDEFEAFKRDTGYRVSMVCGEERLGIAPGRLKQAGNEPAVCINWDDAKAYTTWLSTKARKVYRLLSETEWEYAARAGSELTFISAKNEEELCQFGNSADAAFKEVYKDWTEWRAANCSDGFVHTAPVGSFPANAFGLYDVQGNAAEWVEDCYSGDPLKSCTNRVLRGGSWIGEPRHLRAAARGGPWSEPGIGRGFRVAMTLGH